MAQSTSSGFHTHSSWGRTRRPKNVNGASSTAHAISTTEYFTENQRFLHVQAGTSAAVTKIELYYHASATWSTLQVSDGDGTYSDAAVAAGKVVVFEIAGADKVKVTHAGDSSSAAERTFLSLSTF